MYNSSKAQTYLSNAFSQLSLIAFLPNCTVLLLGFLGDVSASCVHYLSTSSKESHQCKKRKNAK